MLNLTSKENEWLACGFCLRLFKEDSIELELCPDCFQAIVSSRGRYDFTRMEQLITLGEFEDPKAALALRLLLNEFKKALRPAQSE